MEKATQLVRSPGRRLNSPSARHGEPATASTRCTVSGSHAHASAVAMMVITAAAQIGAV